MCELNLLAILYMISNAMNVIYKQVTAIHKLICIDCIVLQHVCHNFCLHKVNSSVRPMADAYKICIYFSISRKVVFCMEG